MFRPYRICVALGLDKPDPTANSYLPVDTSLAGVATVSDYVDRATLKAFQKEFLESQGIHVAQPGENNRRRLGAIMALQLPAHDACLSTSPSVLYRNTRAAKAPEKEHSPDDDKPYGPISDHGRLRDPGKQHGKAREPAGAPSERRSPLPGHRLAGNFVRAGM